MLRVTVTATRFPCRRQASVQAPTTLAVGAHGLVARNAEFCLPLGIEGSMATRAVLLDVRVSSDHGPRHDKLLQVDRGHWAATRQQQPNAKREHPDRSGQCALGQIVQMRHLASFR